MIPNGNTLLSCCQSPVFIRFSPTGLSNTLGTARLPREDGTPNAFAGRGGHPTHGSSAWRPISGSDDSSSKPWSRAVDRSSCCVSKPPRHPLTEESGGFHLSPEDLTPLVICNPVFPLACCVSFRRLQTTEHYRNPITCSCGIHADDKNFNRRLSSFCSTFESH